MRLSLLGSQLTLNQRVQGSSPCAPTIYPIEAESNFSRRKANRFGASCERFHVGSTELACTLAWGWLSAGSSVARPNRRLASAERPEESATGEEQLDATAGVVISARTSSRYEKKSCTRRA